MTRQEVASSTQRRLDPATLAALRAGLHEHRMFRLDQLRDIVESTSTSANTSAPGPYPTALADVRRQLAAAAALALAETDAALARIDKGCYGTCERCGAGIGLERLYAHPQARYCITCHHAEESRP
jgi:DnaK suppressor protein